MSSDQQSATLTLLKEGLTSREVAQHVGLSVQAVAAVKAHITMGTYEKNASATKTARPNAELHESQRDSGLTNFTAEPGIELQPKGILDQLEKDVRNYIDSILSAHSDDYLSLVPSDVQQAVQQKIKEHFKRHPYERRSALPNRFRLDYMDIMDYCKIILVNWPLFEADFGSKREVENHFLNLKAVRNALKHGRELNSVEQKQGEASVEWFQSVLRRDRLGNT
jgi:hypothetical protein